jgi:endonuclease G, mitochondrial
VTEVERDDELTAAARLALRVAVRDHLLADENVTAVDFGLPEHGGEIAEHEQAIRVHVRRKLPLELVELPVEKEIRGLPTDVLEGTYRPELWWQPVGIWPRADPRKARADPLRGGVSVSETRHSAAGTLGTRVKDRLTGAEMILSNWHVLVADWAGRPGQAILQPGRLDGGTAADTVAALVRDAMESHLDAAVARLSSDRRLVNDQLGLGPIAGVGTATLGLRVVKSGRTTGITYGRITGVGGVAQIVYSGVPRTVRHVVTIDPYPGGEVSRPGDSGSVWLAHGDRLAVGLHFAGGDAPERALAIDFATVLTALDVELEPGKAVPPINAGSSLADVMLAKVRDGFAAYASRR